MIRNVLLLLLMGMGMFSVKAQDTMEKTPSTANKEFDIMLETLLSHSVSEVGVEKCPKPAEATFLDARSKPEYEVSHIPSAKWIGFSAFNSKDVEKLDRTKPVVVYCSVGYRSEKIALKLQQLGFSKVMNLYGGIFAWKNQGREVVNMEGTPTEQVHTYNKKWGEWLLKGEKVH